MLAKESSLYDRTRRVGGKSFVGNPDAVGYVDTTNRRKLKESRMNSISK